MMDLITFPSMAPQRLNPCLVETLEMTSETIFKFVDNYNNNHPDIL